MLDQVRTTAVPGTSPSWAAREAYWFMSEENILYNRTVSRGVAVTPWNSVSSIVILQMRKLLPRERK